MFTGRDRWIALKEPIARPELQPVGTVRWDSKQDYAAWVNWSGLATIVASSSKELSVRVVRLIGHEAGFRAASAHPEIVAQDPGIEIARCRPGTDRRRARFPQARRPYRSSVAGSLNPEGLFEGC